MIEKNEAVSLDWDVEHKRFEAELMGLVRALGWKYLKRARRPRVAWNDMVEDMVIFAWRAWRSLRLRNLEPQTIGIWAIADRAVRTSLQGAVFRPIGTMGDRSWADSINNKRNGLKVRSNKEDWQLEGSVEDGQEDSDLMNDWGTWKATLGVEDRMVVEDLESGNAESLKAIKGLKAKKRRLADQFRAFRAG